MSYAPPRRKRYTNRLLTVAGVAAKLGIGRNQAYEAVNSGAIPALRIGERWMVADATIDRILKGELTTPIIAGQDIPKKQRRMKVKK